MVTRAWTEAYPGANMPISQLRATQNSVHATPRPPPYTLQQAGSPASASRLEGHTQLPGLTGKEKEWGYELMTPKSKAAQESKPERLLVSKMELPQALLSFHEWGRNDSCLMSVGLYSFSINGENAVSRASTRELGMKSHLCLPLPTPMAPKWERLG